MRKLRWDICDHMPFRFNPIVLLIALLLFVPKHQNVHAALSVTSASSNTPQIQRNSSSVTARISRAIKTKSRNGPRLPSVSNLLLQSHQSHAVEEPFRGGAMSTKNGTHNSPLSSSKDDDDDAVVFFRLLPRKSSKTLLIFYFAQFLLFLGVGAVIPVLPIYGRTIGLSSASNGLVLAAPALPVLILANTAGRFADIARRPAMLLGMALIALSDLGTAMVTTLVPLVACRIGLGVGRVVGENGERGMLADLTERYPERRGGVMALQQAVLAGGIAVGAPLGGLAVEKYGERAAFLCVTAAATLTGAMYAMFMPETVARVKNDKGGDDGNSVDRAVPESVKWRQLLRQRRWLRLTLFEILMRFGYAAKLSSIPLIASTVLPYGALGAGSLLSLSALVSLLSAPLSGKITDWFGAYRALLFAGTLASVALISLPIGLRLPSPGGWPSGAAGLVAAVVFWSMGSTASVNASVVLSLEMAPKGGEATASALPRAAGDGCYLIAPFLLGFVADLGIGGGKVLGLEVALAGFLGLCGVLGMIVL